jgi:hypothetical protein
MKRSSEKISERKGNKRKKIEDGAQLFAFAITSAVDTLVCYIYFFVAFL